MSEQAMTQASRAFFEARDWLLDTSRSTQQKREEFHWPEVGESFNWAHDVFEVLAADNHTTALWIVDPDGTETKRSFAEMSRRSNQAANWLLAQGVKKGDVAMLMLGNRLELWEIMLACIKLGVVMLPTSVVLGPGELQDRVGRASVRWVFAAPADAVKFAEVPGDYGRICVGFDEGTKEQRALLWEWASFAESSAAADAPIPHRTASSEPCLIYFTSGTTSQPKIVEHSHTSYPLGHLSTMAWIGVRPGDVHSVVSAPGWGKHAWSSFFSPWNVGATIFVLNYGRFDPAHFVSELDRAGVNTFCAPPTVWRMLIQQHLAHKPAGLRELVSAGEPLNPEVIAKIKEWWGIEIRDGYGQTETTCLIGNMPGDEVVPGAMGRSLPGVHVRILDPISGLETEEGEICIPVAEYGRPVNLMTGYVGQPEATDNALRGGVFHTGDVATRDANGVLTFVGRTDDIFKSSDYKVSPFEVESALLEHEYVAEAAVVGAPDPTRLNITKAYVKLADGVTPGAETARAILAHARATLPPYMRVRRVEFAELPKTSSGKIRRVELRQREIDAADWGGRLEGEWREEDFPGLKG